MSLKVENIKKMMGWCPNAKALETGSWISSMNFEAPAQSGGGKTGSLGAISRFTRQFSRLKNRLLLVNVYLTLFYFILLAQDGINPEAFLEGLAFALPLGAFLWKKQMHQYDALAKKPTVYIYNKRKVLRRFFAIILLTLSGSVFLPYVVRNLFHNMQTFYSFSAGTLFFMWISYLQIVYWERKNHMRIYTKSEDGFRTTYFRDACPEGKGGLE